MGRTRKPPKTKGKWPYYLFDSLILVMGLLLCIRGVVLGGDKSIALQNGITRTQTFLGSDSGRVITWQNVTFGYRLTLTFASEEEFTIRVISEDLKFDEVIGVSQSEAQAGLTQKYLGYERMSIWDPPLPAFNISVQKPSSRKFDITVTITEETGFPRFIEAPGYLSAAALATVAFVFLFSYHLKKDPEENPLLFIPAELKGLSGVIFGTFLLGLIVLFTHSFEFLPATNIARNLFPICIPLGLFLQRRELWSRFRESLILLVPFCLCEYLVIVGLDPLGVRLENYYLGYWTQGNNLPALALSYLASILLLTTGAYLVTGIPSQMLYRFSRVRQTKAFRVGRHIKVLESLLASVSQKPQKDGLLEKTLGRKYVEYYEVTWRSEPFIKSLTQMEFEIKLGHIVIWREDLGLFLLPLVLDNASFNLSSKPMWIPPFCAEENCGITQTGEIPFNACLITKLRGYASQKFTPREIEIISIALFLRDGEFREVLRKITEGTINVRFPEKCRGCPKLSFIREEGPGDLPDRPDIEID